jgi:hypothetical protein
MVMADAAALARAGALDFLFKHDLEVIVNTDVTREGARLPQASTEHPVYYVAVSLGYRDLGGVIAGDKLPAKETMYSWIAKALAKQGYLPAGGDHLPTQLVVFTWGSLYVKRLLWNPDRPVQLNRGQMLRFLGGAKLGPMSKYGSLDLGIEFEPELFQQHPGADKFRSAASDDLYMAVLLGYDFQTLTQKERHLLWRTRIASPARGLVMADTLPAMIGIAAPMIAHETKVPAWIRASDKYKPAITIGNPVFEEYLDSGPLSVIDDSESQPGAAKDLKK